MAEKRLLLPRGCFLQSKPLLQEGIRRTRSRISCIFLLYAFIFSRNSPHHTQGLSGRLSGESEVIFRQSGLCTGTSPGKKREAVKKFLSFFPFPVRLFSFAVRKTFRRNAFLFHHNSMQRPALCRQNAQPCSHKGNTPGETGR